MQLKTEYRALLRYPSHRVVWNGHDQEPVPTKWENWSDPFPSDDPKDHLPFFGTADIIRWEKRYVRDGEPGEWMEHRVDRYVDA